jgi:hypothetical protein
LQSTRKPLKRQIPTWLNEAVYEPKRRRTVELVKQAVDTLIEQRKQDSTIRISLNTIVATAKQQDPTGQGIAHTAILENEEAYAYYKRYRTTGKPTKQPSAKRQENTRLIIKGDRDQTRVRQRYLKWSREELVNQLLLVEQQYAELHERYLALNDQLLEGQLCAEEASVRLKPLQQTSSGQARKNVGG